MREVIEISESRQQLCAKKLNKNNVFEAIRSHVAHKTDKEEDICCKHKDGLNSKLIKVFLVVYNRIL